VFEKILMLEVGRWKHDDGSYKYRKNLRKSVNSAGEKHSSLTIHLNNPNKDCKIKFTALVF